MNTNNQSLPVAFRQVDFEGERQRLLKQLKNHVKTVPLATLTFDVLFITIFILDWIIPNKYFSYGSLNLTLSFFPSELSKGKVWALFTYPFVNMRLIDLFCNILFFHLVAYRLERKWGTLKFLYLSFLFFTLTPALLNSLLYLVFPLYMPILFGSFIMFFSFIVIEALEFPQASFCGLFTLPSVIYPIFLLFILSLFSMASLINGILGAIMGYLYGFNYLDILTPSITKFDKFEKNKFPERIYDNSHYCTVENSHKFLLPLFTPRNYDNIASSSAPSSSYQPLPNPPNNSQPTKFPGVGQRVG